MPLRPKSWPIWMMILLTLSMGIIIGYVWLILSSFNTRIHGLTPVGEWGFDNWRFLWERIGRRPSIWVVLVNTLLFAGGVAFLVVSISSMAAYAISRLHFPGRSWFLALVLILHAFPAVSLLIASYYVLSVLGLFDTLLGVILVMTSFMMPFGIWLMKGFFDGLSWEMEMAALVDGASRWTIFFKLALPLVSPGLFALATFTFLVAWGEFILPYTFIITGRVWTFSVYLQSMVGDFELADYGLLAAVGLFYMLPAMVVFFIGQRYLLDMYFGGSKG
jgi:inositol-phosphate transport system permease protein